MLEGLLFAVISNTCFGISNVYWKKAAIEDDFSRIVFFRGCLTVVSIGLIWFFLQLNTAENSLLLKTQVLSVNDVLLTVLLCVASSFGLVCYLLSLNYSPVSISVPLSSINVFSILTAVFILGEVFRPIYALCFLLAGTGVWMIHTVQTKTIKGVNKGLLFSLLASFFWGVSYALFKFPAKMFGAIPLAFILEGCVLVTAFVWNYFYSPLDYKIFNKLSFTRIKHYSVLALLLLGGTLFYNLAVQVKDVLLLNIIGNLSLIVSILLGVFWQKETLTRKQLVGLGLIFLSLLFAQL